jgi:hypothetical protein
MPVVALLPVTPAFTARSFASGRHGCPGDTVIVQHSIAIVKYMTHLELPV